jgi:glutaredoxin
MNIIYTLPDCPNCTILKDFLRDSEVKFVEFPMDDAHSITEMRFNGCFAVVAPVLRTNDGFYDTGDLFKEGKLDENKTRNLTK